MKKVAVLGGTRFFGIHLVEELIRRGVEVTVATRGNSDIPFPDKVKQIVFDREDAEDFRRAFQGTSWDAVYDQICYTSQDADTAIEVFRDKTKHYIFTSSMSVYDLGESIITEDVFDPFSYPIVMGTREDFTYQEGKRHAEAIFHQKAPFPVTSVRFPIVLGKNDYTERLTFHIDRILKKQEIYFDHPESKISFISEEEAGTFLGWLLDRPENTPFNACASGTTSLRALLSLIENETGEEFLLAKEKTEDNASPYNLPESWTLSNEKSAAAGFSFSDLDNWLPHLVRDVTATRKQLL
ncbi:NAD-dependent epimerase/dehydratase family protein [Bacillus gobiensis]|uniref:NAD-dependent epimerase/dehydratase family protein n=1 Tax=Bacillus gobiensis TaxID=1441095 RepID=UPI003D19CD90